ncbi:hypothetical protein Trydic_g12833 [Trypoxylus dichotomus]
MVIDKAAGNGVSPTSPFPPMKAGDARGRGTKRKHEKIESIEVNGDRRKGCRGELGGKGKRLQMELKIEKTVRLQKIIDNRKIEI